MHTKILIRPENFHLRFQQWHRQQFAEHLNWLRNSYAEAAFADGSAELRLEQNPMQARLVWQPDGMETEQMAFFLELFKTRLLDRQYNLQISDERSEVFDNGLRITVHRHFLKPDVAQGPPGVHHLYGNLFLEHRFGSEYNSLCITANYYGDRIYYGFEKLMEILLS